MNREVLIQNKKKKEKLNITYAMRWAGICGGTKIILEHANRLSNRGHRVTIISKAEKPTWFPIEKKVNYIQVVPPKTYGETVPKDTDVVVVSAVTDIVEKKAAPVVFFEQGDNHLFNRKEVDEERLIRKENDYFQCNNVMTVSKYAKSKIKKYYKKNAFVLSNAVDNQVFYYEKHKKSDTISITAIGREDWYFKGLKYIIKAIKSLSNKYNIRFNWITQTDPNTKIGNIIVNPKQKVIGDTLRNTDIYVCASQYESFCLPVLEAMSCGAAVITTDNGGNREFAIDGETCLKIRKKSSKDIEKKVEELIKNPKLKEKLVQNGLKMAQNYNWDTIISDLEEYLREIATYSVK